MPEEISNQMGELKDTLTEEEWLEKKGRNSRDTYAVAKSAISALNNFCQDKYKKPKEQMLRELKWHYDQKSDPVKTWHLLDALVKWMGEDHPNVIRYFGKGKVPTPWKKLRAGSIRQYLPKLRHYFKHVAGIKLPEEDIEDYITFPVDYDEEEQEPFTKNELRYVIESLSENPKRMAFAMVAKDTAGRLKELVQLQKKNFDLTKNPAVVSFPISILKRKKSRRKQVAKRYLTKETAQRIKFLIKDLDDEDLVFGTNVDPYKSRNAENQAWRNLLKRLKMNQKYPNGRNKKNFHSIKAFCQTQIHKATKDDVFSQAYCDHDIYLSQYNRLTEDEKTQKFKQALPYLSIFDDMVVVDNKDVQVEKLSKRIEMLEWALDGPYCEKCTVEKFSQISK